MGWLLIASHQLGFTVLDGRRIGYGEWFSSDLARAEKQNRSIGQAWPARFTSNTRRAIFELREMLRSFWARRLNSLRFEAVLSRFRQK
jgi:hypothetical protein